MNTAQHLDVLEWVKATRADVVDIMKEGKSHLNGVQITTADDIEKAEKVIARVLTEVVNRMVEPASTVEPLGMPSQNILTRDGARKRVEKFLARVFVHSGKELVDRTRVENDIEDLLDDMHYSR